MGCEHRVKINGKGCKFYDNTYCTNDIPQFYRCIDWIASQKPENFYISYSQKRSFDRCPYKWYLEQIMGLRLKDPYLSLPLRLGKRFANIMAGLDDTTYFSDAEYVQSQVPYLMKDIICEYGLIPNGLEVEVELKREGFHGIMDVRNRAMEEFYELKYSGSPFFYLNAAIARNQLEGYFFLDPEMKRAHMLPVRAPGLRQGKDEANDLLLKRIETDVKRRIGYYFPHYNPERKLPQWGRVFSSLEFDPVEFVKEINWTKGEIKRACEADYFVQRTANCLNPFQCDFFSIYESGGINWEIYERRERK